MSFAELAHTVCLGQLTEAQELGRKNPQLINQAYRRSKNNLVHLAVEFDQLEVVRWLLNCADFDHQLVDQPNQHYQAPLQLAIVKQNRLMIALLLQFNNTFSSITRDWAGTTLEYLLINQDQQTLALLLQARKIPSVEINRPAILQLLITQGSPQQVILLLQHQLLNLYALKTTNQDNIFHLAVQRPDHDPLMLQTLLFLNYFALTPLESLTALDSLSSLDDWQYLVPFEVEAPLESLLNYSAKTLSPFNPNNFVNQVNQQGQTPFILAIHLQAFEMAKVLLKSQQINITHAELEWLLNYCPGEMVNHITLYYDEFLSQF